MVGFAILVMTTQKHAKGLRVSHFWGLQGILACAQKAGVKATLLVLSKSAVVNLFWND